MSTSTTTPVIGYDLGSPASPRAVVAWTTMARDPHLPSEYGIGHDRRSSSPGRNKAALSQYFPKSYLSPNEDGSVPPCFAVVFGTERGSLHYRVYPSLDGSSNSSRYLSSDSTSSQKHQGSAGGSSSSGVDSSRIISTSWTGGMVCPMPSFSIDSNAQASFSGPIVSMIRCVNTTLTATNNDHHQRHFDTPQLFLVLVDDNKGSGPQQSQISSGAYSSGIITIKHGTFQKVTTGMAMPRMSCAAYHPTAGFVYAAGTSVLSLPHTAQAAVINALVTGSSSTYYHNPTVRYQAANALPNPVRSNPSALSLLCDAHVAIVAVNNSFYALSSIPAQQQGKAYNSTNLLTSCIKVLSLTQSSQVHPAIVTTISETNASSLVFVASGRECTTCTVSFLDGVIQASPGSTSTNTGTNASSNLNSTFNTTNNNHDIISFTSPILSAVALSSSYQTYVAILTTDGLVQLRLPVCIAVPLRTVEVGTRPNNFYWLGAFSSSSAQDTLTGDDSSQCLLSVGYSGDARVIVVKDDTPLDLSDRLMRLAIDAFGTNGFPRTDLADALHASYSATSYVGPEPSQKAKLMLRQYLEAILGFLFTTANTTAGEEQRHRPSTRGDHHQHQQQMDLILCSLLCLVSTSLTPPSASLANRAAKAATEVTSKSSHPVVPRQIKKVVQAISEVLLQHASSLTMQTSISLIRQSSAPITSSSSKNQGAETAMIFFEAALWLLRAAGLHERAIQALLDQMASSGTSASSSGVASWSLTKYENYIASHLAELWSSCNLDLANFVLATPATKYLLESNPELGLSVFTSSYPKNRQDWVDMEKGISPVTEKDPMYHLVDVHRVVALLRDIKVIAASLARHGHEGDGKHEEHADARSAEISADESGAGLEVQYKGDGSTTVVSAESSLEKRKTALEDTTPLYSGLDLAICFLEAVVGISSDRPLTSDNTTSLVPVDAKVLERTISLHEELAYFLLEGVLCERDGEQLDVKKSNPRRKTTNLDSSTGAEANDDDDDCTTLGRIYRAKLRRLLTWPLFQGRAGKILETLPSSFLREKAMLLGKLSRHEDALRILYHDLQSLELALDYCDARHAQLMRTRVALKRRGIHTKSVSSNAVVEECAYLPLIRVVLESTLSKKSSPSLLPQESDENHLSDTANKRGVNAAIQVLSLRRHVIDQAAALRLLPSTIPVSAVARPFVIPALIESESQVRRYKMASSLLRARYVELKRALTEAQLSSQASLRSLMKLKNLDLGRKDPLRSSKALLARPASSTTAPYFPLVMVTKHFFPRFLVIQAQITNDTPDLRTLGDVAFVVAESSSEDAIVPTLTVPLKALPARSIGSAWCLLDVTPSRLEETALLTCELRFTILAVDVATGVPLSFGEVGGRTYVEELADLEVASEEFLGKGSTFLPNIFQPVRERI